MKGCSALVLLILLACVTANAQSAVDTAIVDLRLEGRLVEAETVVKEALNEQGLSNADAIDMHLELARIYDRMALHDGTRPSTRAKEQLDRAMELQDPDDQASSAAIFYERARYEYRAEMSETLVSAGGILR